MHCVLRNGKIVPRSDAVMDIDDRGYQFGDGVYEVIRLYRGEPFLMKPHMDRLRRSANEIGMRFSEEDTERLQQQLLEVAMKEGVSDGILYVQMTRGVYPRAQIFPPSQIPYEITGYAKAIKRPDKEMKEGIALHLLPDVRWLRCDIKSLNLLPNIMARQEATQRGCAEALQHRDGVVTEGAFSNVFIVMQGRVQTHPTGNRILGGITREHVIRLCHSAGYPVIEEAFSIETLFASEEVFITSTTSEVMPVTTISGKPIGVGSPGPIVRDLQSRYLSV